MIKNVDVKFFRQILNLDENLVYEFLGFSDEIKKLEDIYGKSYAYIRYIYGYLNKDSCSYEDIFKFISLGAKICFYVYYLKQNNLLNFDLNEFIDIRELYKNSDLKNIDPYNMKNLDYYNFHDLLLYILYNDRDEIALNFIFKFINKDEVNKFIEEFLNKLKFILKKHENVLSKLKEINCNIWSYINKNMDDKKDFYAFSNYIKEHFNLVGKIKEVINKIALLNIDTFDIALESTDIDKAYSKEKHQINYPVRYNDRIFREGFYGCEIYTDGKITYLGKKEYTYPVIVSGAKYVLVNDKYIDDDDMGFCWDLKIDNYLIISDFDFDINTLPSYEDLYLFSREIKINEKEALAKKDAEDIINSVDKCRDDIENIIMSISSINKKITFLENKKDLTSSKDKLDLVIKELASLKIDLVNYYKDKKIIDDFALSLKK